MCQDLEFHNDLDKLVQKTSYGKDNPVFDDCNCCIPKYLFLGVIDRRSFVDSSSIFIIFGASVAFSFQESGSAFQPQCLSIMKKSPTQPGCCRVKKLPYFRKKLRRQSIRCFHRMLSWCQRAFSLRKWRLHNVILIIICENKNRYFRKKILRKEKNDGEVLVYLYRRFYGSVVFVLIQDEKTNLTIIRLLPVSAMIGTGFIHLGYIAEVK